MKNPIANIVVLFVVVVALLGQAMAYATMSCNMSETTMASQNPRQLDMVHIDKVHSDTGHSGMNHDKMNHTNMDHANMDHGIQEHAQMNSSDEHCASECECPAGTCHGFSWLAVEPFAMGNDLLHANIHCLNHSHHNLIQTSLYRPPIFA